jgi:hypothetical protein
MLSLSMLRKEKDSGRLDVHTKFHENPSFSSKAIEKEAYTNTGVHIHAQKRWTLFHWPIYL